MQNTNRSSKAPRLFKSRALPGNGWDNLENRPRLPVYKESYSKCTETKDGKYIVPDNIITEAVGQSNLRDTFTIISEYSEYKSLQSQTINAEAEMTGIWGKFSDESEYVYEIINKNDNT